MSGRSTGPTAEPRATRLVTASRPIDVAHSLAPLVRGPWDQTGRREASGAIWKAYRTPAGPACARFSQEGAGARVEAWGDGACWLIDSAPALVGEPDSLDGFEPVGLVRELHRRLPGLRIVCQRNVYETLVPVVLEQKVTFVEAYRSYAELVRRWGEPAPGPVKLSLPPRPNALAALPYFELHPLGIEQRRADTLRRVAVLANRLDAAAARSTVEARALMLTIKGVGPWSYAEVARIALGDADALSLGDFHLPNVVAWNLAGEARGDDARMLELLAPYEGHRGRVQRLLEIAGNAAPRFGPRLRARAIGRR